MPTTALGLVALLLAAAAAAGQGPTGAAPAPAPEAEAPAPALVLTYDESDPAIASRIERGRQGWRGCAAAQGRACTCWRLLAPPRMNHRPAATSATPPPAPRLHLCARHRAGLARGAAGRSRRWVADGLLRRLRGGQEVWGMGGGSGGSSSVWRRWRLARLGSATPEGRRSLGHPNACHPTRKTRRCAAFEENADPSSPGRRCRLYGYGAPVRPNPALTTGKLARRPESGLTHGAARSSSGAGGGTAGAGDGDGSGGNQSGR